MEDSQEAMITKELVEAVEVVVLGAAELASSATKKVIWLESALTLIRERVVAVVEAEVEVIVMKANPLIASMAMRTTTS